MYYGSYLLRRIEIEETKQSLQSICAIRPRSLAVKLREEHHVPLFSIKL